MIRVCPARDAKCPYGMECPYVIDQYECKPAPTSVKEVHKTVGVTKEKSCPTKIQS